MKKPKSTIYYVIHEGKGHYYRTAEEALHYLYNHKGARGVYKSRPLTEKSIAKLIKEDKKQ